MLFCLPCSKSGEALSFSYVKTNENTIFHNKNNFLYCLLLLENLPKIMYISLINANDVTSCDIDMADAIHIYCSILCIFCL